MNKILEFLKQPFATTLLCVIGLMFGFFVGIFGKQVIDLQVSSEEKRQACKDAFSIMCMQVHACTGATVESCDSIVKENQMCSVNLPELQVIFKCKEELRHIECTDDMPASCVAFME